MTVTTTPVYSDSGLEYLYNRVEICGAEVVLDGGKLTITQQMPLENSPRGVSIGEADIRLEVKAWK